MCRGNDLWTILKENLLIRFLKVCHWHGLSNDIFSICTWNENQLINLSNELNIKHFSMKFEYQISKSKISLRDTKVFIEINKLLKQPSRGVKKRCSEILQQICRRTPMLKCDFNKLLCNFVKVALWHGRSLVNLLHILRIPFSKNTSGWLLLKL